MEPTPEKLFHLRKKIDSLDRQLLNILKNRFEVTHRIGILKKSAELPIEDKLREEKQFSNLAKEAKKLGLESQLVQDIFRTILKEVKKKHRRI